MPHNCWFCRLQSNQMPHGVGHGMRVLNYPKQDLLVASMFICLGVRRSKSSFVLLPTWFLVVSTSFFVSPAKWYNLRRRSFGKKYLVEFINCINIVFLTFCSRGLTSFEECILCCETFTKNTSSKQTKFSFYICSCLFDSYSVLVLSEVCIDLWKNPPKNSQFLVLRVEASYTYKCWQSQFQLLTICMLAKPLH